MFTCLFWVYFPIIQFNFTVRVDTRAPLSVDGDTNSLDDFVAKTNQTLDSDAKSNATSDHNVNGTKKKDLFVFSKVPQDDQ